MSLPPSYRVQDGCWNCRHCVAIGEYDSLAQFFCGFEAPPRPKSGSMAMREEFPLWVLDAPNDSEVNTERNALEKAWNEWSVPRSVDLSAICDKHERRRG